MAIFGQRLPDEVAERIPPGNHLVKSWPVLHYGPVPAFDEAAWDFKVFGECEEPFTLTYEELKALPTVDVTADMHCVTTWSTLDNTWHGVRFRDLAERAKPNADANWVIAHCEHGFTANIPIEFCLRDDCLVALRANGEPLSAEHGRPARLVVPRLYAWKSAKWLRGIEFSAVDKPGFWEKNGYHNEGDPWKEQRYWGD